MYIILLLYKMKKYATVFNSKTEILISRYFPDETRIFELCIILYIIDNYMS